MSSMRGAKVNLDQSTISTLALVCIAVTLVVALLQGWG